MSLRPPIERFAGPHAFVSNFHPAAVKYGPYAFSSVEHAYQFAKLPKDKITPEVVAKFQQATAAQAKRHGRTLQQHGMVRPDWETIKEAVMQYLLKQKFAIPELREQLLRTGVAELTEGNLHHDNEWGDCHCVEARPDERRFGRKQGCRMPGRNKLGRMLMAIRTELFEVDPWRCPVCGNPDRLARRDVVPCWQPGRFVNGEFVRGDSDLIVDWTRRAPSAPAELCCLDCHLSFMMPAAPASPTAERRRLNAGSALSAESDLSPFTFPLVVGEVS